jgi:large subunit ribosomal protein L25
MSDRITLEAQLREVTGKKVKQFRAEGMIPGVIYGPKVDEPVKVLIDNDDLRLSLREAGGTNLIQLNVAEDMHNVLVRDVQRHVLKGNILHVDFYAVSLDTKITTEVPIAIVGSAEVVRSGEAMLITRSNTIEVECLPTNIPQELELDISRLVEVGDFLTVADLTAPEGVTILADEEEVLVRTEYATRLETEEEEEGLEEEGLDMDAESVEVIRKGKEEEEDF